MDPKKLTLKFAIVAIAVTLSGTAAEFGLRIAGFPHSSPYIKYDPNCYWRMAPSQSFEFTDEYRRPAVVNINSLGARGAEFPREKPAGEKRLLCVGDSYTYGWGVGDDATYEAFLQNLFRSEGKNVRVINMGCNGHTILQEAGVVRTYGFPLQPDAVLVGFCMNDFQDIDELQINLKYMPAPGYNAIKYVVRRTAIGNIALDVMQGGKVRKILDQRRRSNGGASAAARPRFRLVAEAFADEPPRTAFNRYMDELDGLVEDSAEKGLPVVYVLVPAGTAKSEDIRIKETEGRMTQGAFARFIERRYGARVAVVNLAGRFPDDGFFLSDGHLNAEGNRRAAAEIHARIKNIF